MVTNTSILSAGFNNPTNIESDEEFDDTGIDTPKAVRDHTFESFRTTIVPLNEVSTNPIARVPTPKPKNYSSSRQNDDLEEDSLIKMTKLISEDNKVNTPIRNSSLMNSPVKLNLKPLNVTNELYQEEFDNASDESPTKPKKNVNQTALPAINYDHSIRTPTANPKKRSFSESIKPSNASLVVSSSRRNDVNHESEPIVPNSIVNSPTKRKKTSSFQNNSQNDDFQLLDEDISRASILAKVNQTLESIHQPSRFLASPNPSLRFLPSKNESHDDKPREAGNVSKVNDEIVSTSDDELERKIEKYERKSNLRSDSTPGTIENGNMIPHSENITKYSSSETGNKLESILGPKIFPDKLPKQNVFNSPTKSSPLKYQTSPIVESTPKVFVSRRGIDMLSDIKETSNEVSKDKDLFPPPKDLKLELSDDEWTKLYSLSQRFTESELINSTWLLHQLGCSKEDLSEALYFLKSIKKKNERPERRHKKSSK